MNLRHLEIFVAIAESGSFSSAAEAVSLNQSTLSQHIAALEKEVGTLLLDRTGKGVTVTGGGKVFLQHARRVLHERDVLTQAMAGFKGLRNVQLEIGASNIPANYLIPPLLPVLREKHPGISLKMVTGDSRDIINRLLASEIELAVVGSNTGEKSIAFSPLISDRLVLIVGVNHPLRSQTITLEDLAELPLIVREGGSGSGRALEHSLREAGFDPGQLNIVASLGSNEAVRQAVAAGAGAAFVSEFSIRHAGLGQEIHKVTMSGLNIERQIWLARLKSHSDSPAVTAFCEILRKHYSD